jgi:UDP-sugar transporter A1/2/3
MGWSVPSNHLIPLSSISVSVILTGVLSMLLFGTKLNVVYFLGIVNVVIAVLLYNGRKETLEKYMC